MERICRTCETQKPLDQFETVRKSLTGKDLKRKDCKECHYIKRKQNELYRFLKQKAA